MNYLELCITTQSAGIDALAGALTAAGFADLVIEDQQELESFLEDNRAYWDYIDESLQSHLQGLSQIKLYLEDTQEEELRHLRRLLQELREKNDPRYGALELSVTPLAATDWSESWKENYPPQEIGAQLVVLPYWLKEDYCGQRLPIILDPGLTFGTGAHPSTQMVLEFMEELSLQGAVCLDLGSGSGILSITALRLGAKQATGMDIDPKAEDIARENAAYNGFSAPEFTAMTGNVTGDKALMDRLCETRYDLVLVNIVADVIIALAPFLPRLMTQDTVLLLSGILDTRLEDVRDALHRAGLEIVGQKSRQEWRSLKVRKQVW